MVLNAPLYLRENSSSLICPVWCWWNPDQETWARASCMRRRYCGSCRTCWCRSQGSLSQWFWVQRSKWLSQEEIWRIAGWSCLWVTLRHLIVIYNMLLDRDNGSLLDHLLIGVIQVSFCFVEWLKWDYVFAMHVGAKGYPLVLQSDSKYSQTLLRDCLGSAGSHLQLFV